MSLLLEALKKAEKAKEEAQRRARGESSTELRLQDDAAGPGNDARHVVTRDELPDISQPLEILSDDIASKGASEPEQRPVPGMLPPAAPPLAAALSAAPKPAAPKPAKQQGAAREAATAAAQASDRTTAKKVFEAKFKEPNPRLPFYITMGALGAFALGTVGYFWVQLRPPPALASAVPRPTGGEGSAVVAAQNPPVATATAAAQNAIPGLPGADPAAAPAAAGAPPQPQIAATAPPSAAPSPVKPAPRAAPAPQPRSSPAPAGDVSVSRAAPQVHPRVDSAYSAYLAGDLNAARTDYQQALREDPANRDALLGIAALDVRSGRFEAAEATYLRLLQSDPRDSHAQAALISLRGARMDPLLAESRVKSLIALDPGAYELYFTLGNQFAQQARWAEAQQQYFKAFSGDPENADFAYNLAVSLDHLGQGKPALEYYRRALTLAEKRGSSFDAGAARERAAQLGR
jgi:tetratricopeptide (TPR) repeat protein